MSKINELKKDNHYVPQFYLKQWSHDTKNIFVYRRSVSHKEVPLWSKQSIRSTAKQLHLYTESLAGKDTHEFEIWFDKHYETPVQNAYLKAISDKKLNRDDWKKIIDFTASQLVRTPKFYFKSNDIMRKAFNKICNEDLLVIIEDVTKKIEDGEKLVPPSNLLNRTNQFKDIVNFEIDKENKLGKASIMLGRDAWLDTIKHLLLNTSKILHEHSWSIVSVHNEVEIPTSDAPVICLNFNSLDDYDFGGGWNYKGSEIIFPLSPQKILYTQVGKKLKSNVTFNKDQSLKLQSLIIDHTYRYLYAKNKIKGMFKLLPREINKLKFDSEKELWMNWNENQKIDKP